MKMLVAPRFFQEASTCSSLYSFQDGVLVAAGGGDNDNLGAQSAGFVDEGFKNSGVDVGPAPLDHEGAFRRSVFRLLCEHGARGENRYE
jgi:hypothetical protein